MKINCYRYERRNFFSKLNEMINYDIFYSMHCKSLFDIGFKCVIVTVDTRNMSNFNLYIGVYFLDLFTKQRFTFYEKSTNYKVKSSIMQISIRNKNLEKHINRKIKVYFPIFRVKSNAVSKNFDNNGQLIQTFFHINSHFRRKLNKMFIRDYKIKNMIYIYVYHIFNFVVRTAT